MAYTRREKESSGGLHGKIMLNATGEYEWELVEFYEDAEYVGKTGTFTGKTNLAEGKENDYDAASAALKIAFVAAL